MNSKRNAKIFAVTSFVLAFIAMYSADAVDGMSLTDDPYRGYYYQRTIDVLGYFFLALALMELLPEWWFCYLNCAALLCRTIKTSIDLFEYHLIDWVYFGVVAGIFLTIFYRTKWQIKQRKQ